MTTYHELLPATKTGPAAAIDWTPGCYPGTGLVVIRQHRATCTYVLTEMPTDWDGRFLRFVKPAGEPGTDPSAATYDVFVDARGRHDRCGCRGFERFGRCKHADAARALIDNGWLALSEPA